jgi:hypothetical protein
MQDKTIVETRSGRTESHRAVTYELELVRCNKPKCGSCKRSPAHGPYWYGYWRTGRRLRKKYIGKTFRELRDRELGDVEARRAGPAPSSVLGNNVDELVDDELPKTGDRRGPRWGFGIQRGAAFWRNSARVFEAHVEAVKGNKAYITCKYVIGDRRGGKWVRVENVAMRTLRGFFSER